MSTIQQTIASFNVAENNKLGADRKSVKLEYSKLRTTQSEVDDIIKGGNIGTWRALEVGLGVESQAKLLHKKAGGTASRDGRLEMKYSGMVELGLRKEQVADFTAMCNTSEMNGGLGLNLNTEQAKMLINQSIYQMLGAPDRVALEGRIAGSKPETLPIEYWRSTFLNGALTDQEFLDEAVAGMEVELSIALRTRGRSRSPKPAGPSKEQAMIDQQAEALRSQQALLTSQAEELAELRAMKESMQSKKPRKIKVKTDPKVKAITDGEVGEADN